MTQTSTQGRWHPGNGNGEGSIFADEGRVRLEAGGTTLYPIADSLVHDEPTRTNNLALGALAPELAECHGQLMDPDLDDDTWRETAMDLVARLPTGPISPLPWRLHGSTIVDNDQQPIFAVHDGWDPPQDRHNAVLLEMAPRVAEWVRANLTPPDPDTALPELSTFRFLVQHVADDGHETHPSAILELTATDEAAAEAQIDGFLVAGGDSSDWDVTRIDTSP